MSLPPTTPSGFEDEVRTLAFLLYERRLLHIQKGDPEYTWLGKIPEGQTRRDDWRLAEQLLESPYRDQLVQSVTQDLKQLQNHSPGRKERW